MDQNTTVDISIKATSRQILVKDAVGGLTSTYIVKSEIALIRSCKKGFPAIATTSEPTIPSFTIQDQIWLRCHNRSNSGIESESGGLVNWHGDQNYRVT